MAESNSAAGDFAINNDNSISISDPMDVDIAATLGLYDDPSTIMVPVMDLSEMQGDDSDILQYRPISPPVSYGGGGAGHCQEENFGGFVGKEGFVAELLRSGGEEIVQECTGLVDASEFVAVTLSDGVVFKDDDPSTFFTSSETSFTQEQVSSAGIMSLPEAQSISSAVATQLTILQSQSPASSSLSSPSAPSHSTPSLSTPATQEPSFPLSCTTDRSSQLTPLSSSSTPPVSISSAPSISSALSASTSPTPSTLTLAAPSTSTSASPSTSTSAAPSTSTLAAPSTSTLAAPSTSTLAAPSTSTLAAPSKSTLAAPSTSTLATSILSTLSTSTSSPCTSFSSTHSTCTASISVPTSSPVSSASALTASTTVSTTATTWSSTPTPTCTSTPPANTSTSSSVTSTSSSPSSSTSTSVLDTTPKGLNLPLYQFLQANFPGLQFDSLKNIFQVNTLLAHTLQQQQQQLQLTTEKIKQQTNSSVKTTTSSQESKSSEATKFPAGIASLKAAKSSSSSPQSTISSAVTSRSGSGISLTTADGTTQTMKIGGRTVTNTTLKFTGDGPTGIKVGRLSSSGIKIGGETPVGSNLVIGKAGPVKVIPLLSASSSSSVSSSSSMAASSKEDKLSKADKGSRTPVFAQILANLRRQGGSITSAVKSVVSSTTPVAKASIVVPTLKKSSLSSSSFTSPLVLSRQRTSVADLHKAIVSHQAAAATPTATRMASKRTAAKRHQSELSQTLVEQEEAEPMDVDVGKPFQMLELPQHLTDHSYSCYNPEEGEKVVTSGARPKTLRLSSSIPPARVSYAPQVPDSPTTLYKLLKVTPRKQGRRPSVPGSSRTSGAHLSRLASGGSIAASMSSSSRARKRKAGFTLSSGNVPSRKGRASRASRAIACRGSSDPSSRAESEDPEVSFSSSDPSADESGNSNMSKSKNRRRSERTAGQRKRYVDDLNLAFSDEEMQEDVMNVRPLTKKEYRGYGEEEDWEYDEGIVGREGMVHQGPRSSKQKKAASMNPTEGFQYSDIYFEPPAEDANIVDRILMVRTRKTKTEDERKKYGDNVEEYLVKYRNYSHLHTTWATMDHILVGDKRFEGKIKRYKAKMALLGSFVNLDEEPFNPEYTVVDRILDVATQTEPNNEVVTHYLVKWRSLPYEDATWELEEDVDSESICKFNQLHILPPEDELEFNPRPPPNAYKSLKDTRNYRDNNVLRPYQLEGVNWLLFNWYARQNCILADEMGLGKTVQSIAFLLQVMKSGIRGPFLVIAPLSTITNWQREFEAWTDINVILYHGSVYSRRLIHEYELYYRDSERRVISDAFKFNVVITTYEVMLSDDSELQAIQWRVVVIDEAHRLKNRNCKLLEELKTLDMEHRILLTGTPLQNSVEELFSLLNFLEPSTFPSHISFLQQFGDLKTEEQVEELKAILKPMMLRRLKVDVEKSLAPKEETIVEVELTVIQKQYYRAILERNFSFLSKGPGSGATTLPSLLNVMMELRKCCNHPFLIQGAEHQIVREFQMRNPHKPATSTLTQSSGKMVLVDKLLSKLKESGHKVLIFSQMVRCLDILEDFLRIKGYFYERIDGNVRGIHRQEAIDRFSKPNSDRFVFLLCTRAGGLGINLTAADTVIIYDSDWNPQNDLQAQARCHRIGQNKSVKVYRLITHNTYEREMFDRASLKLGLDRAILQSMQQHNSFSGNGAPQLTRKEVEDLLKKGAYGAIMDEDDDANKFCEEDIDQILERRTHIIRLESEVAGSSFSKASFTADGSSDLSVDDPNFWKKWAEKANLDLDELTNKDSLVLDTPRLRRQVRRYGNDTIEEIVEMNDVIDEVIDIIPSAGKHGWTKLECLKVEKGLLVYGWREWMRILRYGKFRKRKLGIRDVESIARNILMYCLAHFTGDNQVPPYILRLLDPTYVTESPPSSDEDSLYYEFTADDFQILRCKDPEMLFQDVTYMKHLRRHSNKILLRARQLHIMRWSMFIDLMDDINKGTPAKSLCLDLPKPEEAAPAPWWSTDCDHSLLVGILKHGYEQFGLMRSDPALCFKAMCGEGHYGTKKKKDKKGSRKKGPTSVSRRSWSGGDAGDIGIGGDGDDSEGSDSGEESDGGGDSGPSTPAASNSMRVTRGRGSATSAYPANLEYKIGGLYVWPGLAEVNTRARRFVSAWIRHQKREETKLAYLQKERERKEKFAETSRRKEQKKAELAQKWSKREEQDFVRVILFFGVEFNRSTNRYDWTRFRQLANLSKKTDERLTLYLHDFKQMCWRVLKKKKVKRGLSGFRVESISEEKASRILLRISLLHAIREEILPHPLFSELIKLCELSFEVPQWWMPGSHDTDLLRGVVKHGLYRSNQLIYNDTELSFKETVPQTALFDSSINQAVEDGAAEGSEDEEEEENGDGQKLRLTTTGIILPLGWPKEKAIVIRMTRIVYAFRNKVWPKPMEGLDLFAPVVKQEESSSDSSEGEENIIDCMGRDEEDEERETWGSGSDSDCNMSSLAVESKRGLHGVKFENKFAPEGCEEEGFVDIEGEEMRDFEIEKSQGLKMTLKKSGGQAATSGSESEPIQLEVKIPLVQLSFPSGAGMKRIPKKRPAPTETSPSLDGPESKKKKQESSEKKQESKSSYFKVVDPTTVTFAELTGQERVGVINRNTNEKLPARQSPMLKNLRLWLEGHPHFNVEANWGSLVLEWGALRPEMFCKILQKEQ